MFGFSYDLMGRIFKSPRTAFAGFWELAACFGLQLQLGCGKKQGHLYHLLARLYIGFPVYSANRTDGLLADC